VYTSKVQIRVSVGSPYSDPPKLWGHGPFCPASHAPLRTKKPLSLHNISLTGNNSTTSLAQSHLASRMSPAR